MLPRAVREQAERAEAAHLALLGKTAPAAPTQEPVVTPPVEAVQEVITPVAPVVAPPAQAETPPEPVVDSWELKYKVLEGKYRAEVPRLAEEVRQLKAAQTAPATAPAVAEEATTGVTPETVAAQYGDDFAAAVEAVADAKVKKLRDELSPQVEGMAASAAERARNDFLRDLTNLVRNWQVIDQDAGFTAYLDEFDAQTGRTRREFFNEADRANNAARVASFFASYATGKKTPQVPAPVAAAPATPSVDHLISPDSSRLSEAPPGKKLWTRAEIAKFYNDSRATRGSKPYGLYSAAEFAAIDSDLNAALAEGRIVG